jgi:hypothetical protein
MEGYCSTGQSPQRAVVPVEEEEDDDDGQQVCPKQADLFTKIKLRNSASWWLFNRRIRR